MNLASEIGTVSRYGDEYMRGMKYRVSEEVLWNRRQLIAKRCREGSFIAQSASLRILPLVIVLLSKVFVVNTLLNIER